MHDVNWYRSIEEIVDVGWPVILLVEIGLLIVAVSLQFKFEESASGAVLVCVALICEVWISNSPWKNISDCVGFNYLKRVKLPSVSHESVYAYKIIDSSNASFDLGYIHYSATAQLDRLMERALAEDFDSNCREFWDFRRTSRRILRCLSIIIVMTAIGGTLLWGYGSYII